MKYKFNEHYNKKLKKYDESVVGFNKTIIKFQLNYFLKEKYSKDLTEITNVKNSEGLSPADKLAMNQNKIDEGMLAITDMNVKFTEEYIERMIDIKLEEGEMDYYKKHFIPSPIQEELVNAYLTKYFDSYRDLNLLTRENYIHLLLLLKKKLLMELGYEDLSKGEIRCAALPYILTGNLSEKVSVRSIRNAKFVQKVEQSYTYNELIHNKYRLLEEIKPGYIMNLLSKVINTRFTYCVFEYPEVFGEEIYYPEDKIADELLFFLYNI